MRDLTLQFVFTPQVTGLVKLKTIFSNYWFAMMLALFLIPSYQASSAAALGEILPLGDSITDGLGGTGGGYRARLFLLLNNAGDLFRLVGSSTTNSTATLSANGQNHHEGHSGYRIDQIEGNLTGFVSSAPEADSSNGGHWLDGGNGLGRTPIFPDLILLHIGTNDASQGRTAAQMQTSLDSLLTKIKTNRPNAQVIVTSLIPRTDDSGLEAIQMAYNSAIPQIVGAKGPNFHFLDMHSVITAADLIDGQHPNQGGYDKMANAWSSALHTIAQVEPLSLASAVSRKAHGQTVSFDVGLPLTGAPGVECRPGGTYSILFIFTNNVINGTATVVAGNGSISGAATFAGNVMTVSLTGVTDAQQLTVNVSATDAYSHSLPARAVKVNFLGGDTNGSGAVNSSDISQTKAQSGSPLTAANFRVDATQDGAISSSDIAYVKSQSGKAIPSTP
ncbi:MAG TPA: GDSL-type esterase/lipase family protein [Terriglobales bacterium]|nr:GDSL-type esterase/lipase family protein [Terriglobales bacterium]